MSPRVASSLSELFKLRLVSSCWKTGLKRQRVASAPEAVLYIAAAVVKALCGNSHLFNTLQYGRSTTTRVD